VSDGEKAAYDKCAQEVLDELINLYSKVSPGEIVELLAEVGAQIAVLLEDTALPYRSYRRLESIKRTMTLFRTAQEGKHRA